MNYDIKPNVGTPINLSTPWASYVIGAWLFNENAGLEVRSSGLDAQVGTFNANMDGTNWVGGDKGPAVSLNGSNERIDVPDHKLLEATTELTMLLRAKSDSVSSARALVTKWDYSSQGSWVFERNGSRYRIFIANALNDLGGNRVDSGSGVVTANVWESSAFVYNGNKATNATRLIPYHNGRTLASLVYTGTIPSSLQDSTATLKFGSWGGSLSRYFDGDYDYVYLIKKALTPEEILIFHYAPYLMFMDNYVEIFGKSTAAEILDVINGFGVVPFAR